MERMTNSLAPPPESHCAVPLQEGHILGWPEAGGFRTGSIRRQACLVSHFQRLVIAFGHGIDAVLRHQALPCEKDQPSSLRQAA